MIKLYFCSYTASTHFSKKSVDEKYFKYLQNEGGGGEEGYLEKLKIKFSCGSNCVQ